MIYSLVHIFAAAALAWPASGALSQTAPPSQDDDGYHWTEVIELEHEDENGEEVRGVLQNIGWVNVLGFELRGRTGPFQFATGDNTGALWCTGGSERFADARIDVPHNAQLTFFRMWGFDNSADHDLAAFLRESCLPDFATGAPVNTTLTEISSSGSPGTFTETIDLNFESIVTDTRRCTYYVRVRFAAGCADSGQLTVRKLRVQYDLNP